MTVRELMRQLLDDGIDPDFAVEVCSDGETTFPVDGVMLEAGGVVVITLAAG